MAQSQNVIKLNGHEYDASTGKPLTASKKAPTKASTAKSTATVSAPKLVDGVRAPRRISSPVKVGHNPEHAKTLMRHVVKKPVVLHADKRQAPAPKRQSTEKSSAIKAPIGTKPERELHAAAVHKSALISKFGRIRTPLKADLIPVRPAPAKTSEMISTHSSAPVVAETRDPISSALERANSHLQPKLKKPSAYHRVAHKLHLRPAVLATGLSAFALLIAGGWLAYNNIPNIAMKIAATRAGVNASLPTYHPAGFSLKEPISYDHGQVSIKFSSNTDDRNFTVVQKASDWNSQTLLENVIGQKQHQTIESNGRTIYVYDDNDATWVDGGTLYQIRSNATLSSDQVLKIVDSL